MAVRGSSAVLAAADLPLRAAVVTAPGVAPAPGRLLDDERLAEVRRGFTDLLAVGPHLEPHLKGVLDDTLQHPGSLLRAQLAYGLLLDGGADPETSLELAVAIEYFHTASLLLDDLPAMDDGLLRRGQPCAHRVHGEGAAILGALGLITRAYALLWQGIATLRPERRRIAGDLVEECLGVEGILEGQARDLYFGTPLGAAEAVEEVADGKTSTLFRLCLELPVLVTGSDLDLLPALAELASDWGLIYQGLDDFKDLLEPASQSGKTHQRDSVLGRPNLVTTAGFGGARERLESLLERSEATVRALVAKETSKRLLGAVQTALTGKAEGLFRRADTSGSAGSQRNLPARRSTAAPGILAVAQQEMRRWGQTSRTLVLTFPAPDAAAEALLTLEPDQPGVFWHRGGGAAWAGVGAVHELTARSGSRFLGLQAQAARLRRDLVAASVSGLPSQAPRFFGGLAFQAGGADAPPWSGFGDARFVLPRFVYERGREGAWLKLALRGDEIAQPSDRRRWLAEAERILAQLSVSGPPSQEGVEILHTDRPPRDLWVRRLSALLRELRKGRLLKVVTARRSRLVLAAEPDVAAVLGRLPALGRSFRFVFRHGSASFMGASPERLVALSGGHFETEALAGTVAAGETPLSWEEAGDKLQLEHRLVVEEIERRITPFCSSLSVAERPESRGHGRVAHLATAVSGTLAARRHILELASTLHPTPAVGGLPTAGALHWISRHEPDPRGWYAAPVGWFDTDGNGELAVALRCALLKGQEAFVYTGAGIVPGSDPLEEAEEVDLKERTLLEALGNPG